MKALPSSTVVYYLHRVGSAQAEFYPNGISRSSFEKSLRHLLNLGYKFLPLKKAFELAGSRAQPTAVLSVDDGLSCIYHEILPIIKTYSLPLTVFVIGKCIDNRDLAWNHKLIQIRKYADDVRLEDALTNLHKRYSLGRTGNVFSDIFSVADAEKDKLCDELWEIFCPRSQEEYLAKEQPFLSLGQMRELAEYGVEFALHSQTHADFSRLSYPDMYRELLQNQEALSEAGFDCVPFFAFPYGKQCDKDLLPALCRDASLKSCLGFRYCYKDNDQARILWQRISLEHNPYPGTKELLIKPVLRKIKDRISWLGQ